MRICLIGNPKSIFIQRWSKFYHTQDLDVHIICFTPIKNLHNKFSIPGATVHRIILLTNLFLDLQTFFNYIQLIKIIKTIKPDILHIHYISYHAWLAALLQFHPFIVSAWGGDIYIEAKRSKKCQKWVKSALKNADYITTTSKTLKKVLIENYYVNPKMITNFYWGHDLNIFKSGYDLEVAKLRKKFKIDPDLFVILSPRNMDEFHGISYIVESIPYVIQQRKNVRFIFLRGTGSIDFENRMKKRVKKLNVETYVTFIEKFQSPIEMAVFDNLADVVISLPISDQFSGAIEEAMACGAIPVVRDLEVYREHLVDGRNGFFVNREKPEEVAKKIIYCIDHHPELKENFAKINRKIIEERSDWNKNAKLMLEIYGKLLED